MVRLGNAIFIPADSIGSCIWIKRYEFFLRSWSGGPAEPADLVFISISRLWLTNPSGLTAKILIFA